MKKATLQKKVAGVTLTVPVYENEAVTDALIAKVNERVAEIEDASSRIDTQAFALLAALSFAAEHRTALEERKEAGESLLKSLRKVTEALRALSRDVRF